VLVIIAMKNEKKAISKTLKERQTIKVVVMGDGEIILI